MNRTAVHLCQVVSVAFCLLVSGSLLRASPSGLNNIPTTDVVPKDALVLQTWLNLANSTRPQQYIGFKTSLLEGLEFGIDWKANGKTHGHAELQVKYAFNIVSDVWKGVVGVANVSGSRQHNGYFFPYVATSVDLKFARFHLGYAPQPHNEAFFAGIDKTITFLDRNLQLKADAIQFNDKKDVLFSAGFLYELGRKRGPDDPKPKGLLGILDKIASNMILEAWISLPTTSDREVYTLKLNYVIKF